MELCHYTDCQTTCSEPQRTPRSSMFPQQQKQSQVEEQIAHRDPLPPSRTGSAHGLRHTPAVGYAQRKTFALELLLAPHFRNGKRDRTRLQLEREVMTGNKQHVPTAQRSMHPVPYAIAAVLPTLSMRSTNHRRQGNLIRIGSIRYS